MANRGFKIEKKTSLQWGLHNPILGEGEQGFETDTNRMKIGNGLLHWYELPYVVAGAADENSMAAFRAELTPAPPTDFEVSYAEAGFPSFVSWGWESDSVPPMKWLVVDSTGELQSRTSPSFSYDNFSPNTTESITVTAVNALASEPVTFDYLWTIAPHANIEGSGVWDGESANPMYVSVTMAQTSGAPRSDISDYKQYVKYLGSDKWVTAASGTIVFEDGVQANGADYVYEEYEAGDRDWEAGALWVFVFDGVPGTVFTPYTKPEGAEWPHTGEAYVPPTGD